MGLNSHTELKSTHASVDVSFMESHDHVYCLFCERFPAEDVTIQFNSAKRQNKLPAFVVDSSGIRETISTMSRL